MAQKVQTQRALEFANAAARYCSLMDTREPGTPQEFILAVHDILPELLYRGAALPDIELGRSPDVSLYEKTSEFSELLGEPLNAYLGDLDTFWDVWDPLDPDDHEADAYSLACSLAELYRDLARGLAARRRLRGAISPGVAWHWRWGYKNHWGYHALRIYRTVHALRRRVRSVRGSGMKSEIMGQCATDFAAVATRFCSLVDDRTKWMPKEFLSALHDILPELLYRGSALPETEPGPDHKTDLEEHTKRFSELLEPLRAYLGDLDTYWAVFNPADPEDREANACSLARDLAELYMDLKEGLEAPLGPVGAISARTAWDWQWGYKHHWGYHALAAYQAIHALLFMQGLADELTEEDNEPSLAERVNLDEDSPEGFFAIRIELGLYGLGRSVTQKDLRLLSIELPDVTDEARKRPTENQLSWGRQRYSEAISASFEQEAELACTITELKQFLQTPTVTAELGKKGTKLVALTQQLDLPPPEMLRDLWQQLAVEVMRSCRRPVLVAAVEDWCRTSTQE